MPGAARIPRPHLREAEAGDPGGAVDQVLLPSDKASPQITCRGCRGPWCLILTALHFCPPTSTDFFGPGSHWEPAGKGALGKSFSFAKLIKNRLPQRRTVHCFRTGFSTWLWFPVPPHSALPLPPHPFTLSPDLCRVPTMFQVLH